MAIGDELNKGKEAAKELRQETQFLVDAFTSLGATISTAINSALEEAQNLDTVSKKIAKTYERDITNGLKKINTGLDKQLELQIKVNKGQDISKELEKEKIRRQATVLSIQSRIDLLTANDVKLKEELKASLKDELDKSNKILKNLERQNAEREKNVTLSEKLLGGLDGVLNRIDKTGNLSKILNLDKTQKSFGAINKLSAGLEKNTGKGLSTFEKLNLQSRALVGNIDKTALRLGIGGILLKGAQALFKKFLEFNQQSTDLGRNLSMSNEEAGELVQSMAKSSLEAGLTGVTLKEQIKTVNALNKGFGGIASSFTEEIRVGAADTLNRLKLSEESVANMAKLSLITGKSFKETELTQAKSALDAEREFGIRLNLRNVLDEANQISGALRINAEKLPGGIAKAVAVAKSLGAEFKTIADAAGTLLDFEGSIQKELEAELLIGRDLNLEKARLLALNGDIEGVGRELIAQAGGLNELQSMNVIQQQALAGALGLSSDQLSDILLNQKSLNATAQEGLDRDAAKTLENEKQLSIQEKQSKAVEKLGDAMSLLGNFLIVAAAAAAALAIGLTLGVGAGPILLGMAAAGAAAYGLKQLVADGIAPAEKGPFTITDRYGATAITTKGDGLAVSPNINQGTDNREAKRTNMLLEQILTKQGTVKIDSTQAGTAFAMGTYQVQ
ncbi:hypothetical protein N9Z41_00325 [bacterium]|nr:hypothetical protein [bacterium]